MSIISSPRTCHSCHLQFPAGAMECLRCRQSLGMAPPRAQSGALPWRIGRCGNLRVLLVTSRRRSRWILPKGWQAAGRSSAASAEREAFEEAGIIGTIGQEPLGSYRYLKQRDGAADLLCEVEIYGLKVRGTLIDWREKGQRKRKWCSMPEAISLIDEPGLKQLLLRLDVAGLSCDPAALRFAGQAG